jgi:hypothetical protein
VKRRIVGGTVHENTQCFLFFFFLGFFGLIIDWVVIVPYRRNPDFVGRHSILEQIKEQFGHGKHRSDSFRSRVALYGLGGVGYVYLPGKIFDCLTMLVANPK